MSERHLNGTGNVNQGRDDKANNTDHGDDTKSKAKGVKVPKGKKIQAKNLVGKIKGL